MSILYEESGAPQVFCPPSLVLGGQSSGGGVGGGGGEGAHVGQWRSCVVVFP